MPAVKTPPNRRKPATPSAPVKLREEPVVQEGRISYDAIDPKMFMIEGDLVFEPIKFHGKPVHVKLVADVDRASIANYSTFSFDVNPVETHLKEFAQDIKLEEIFAEDYQMTTRSIELRENNKVTLKLNKPRFNKYFGPTMVDLLNNEFTFNALEAVLMKVDTVVATVAPGIFWNTNTRQYGFYFTLMKLDV